MFAIISLNNKQYKIQINDIITFYNSSLKVGDIIQLHKVLIIANSTHSIIGNPLILGTTILGQIIEKKRGIKKLIFKKKRRKHSEIFQGFRESILFLRILTIQI